MEINEKKTHELSEISNIDLEFLEFYLEENNLNVNKIIENLKSLNFNKDIIPILFFHDYNLTFNPFIYLIMEMKNSIKNMYNNFKYFEKYNLQKDILRFYYGIVHLVKRNPDVPKKIGARILKKFDTNLAKYIEKDKVGQSDEIKWLIKHLTNILKFNHNGELINDCWQFDYIRKMLNIAYMRIFLEIANVDEETFEILSHLELRLLSDSTYEDDDTFFINVNLYDGIVFDKILEMFFDDFESNEDVIYDLFEQFIEKVEDNFLFNDLDKKEEKNKKEKEEKENKESENKESENKEKVINKNTLSYLNLEKLLKEKIIGQDNVIEKLVERIKIANFGVSKEVGAKAVFLLAGPTGIGKTEIVKLISQNIGDNSNNKTKSNLIRLDMSEYKESHTGSKIIGAPPGYVGYDDLEDNTVFDKIRRNPNAIILLDEIEKAHPEVLDIFLHIFDEGKAMTNKQKEVDFRNNIFFMTTNIGSFEASKNAIGFDNNRDKNLDKLGTYKKALEKYLRPEFINRIDEIIIFNSLTKENVATIINNQISNLEKIIKEEKQMNIGIKISNEALEYLINKSDYSRYGAREIRRIIETHVLKPIINNLSNGINLNNRNLHIDYVENGLDYRFEKIKILTKEM
ncbi:MAG: ATP-dependent Clp protease ATP-binding subunit [Mollicutes bacterium]|nr:ATP-dependent Clp protease ATP-binding subunit [Mollicutes bacterium]